MNCISHTQCANVCTCYKHPLTLYMISWNALIQCGFHFQGFNSLQTMCCYNRLQTEIHKINLGLSVHWKNGHLTVHVHQIGPLQYLPMMLGHFEKLCWLAFPISEDYTILDHGLRTLHKCKVIFRNSHKPTSIVRHKSHLNTTNQGCWLVTVWVKNHMVCMCPCKKKRENPYKSTPYCFIWRGKKAPFALLWDGGAPYTSYYVFSAFFFPPHSSSFSKCIWDKLMYSG